MEGNARLLRRLLALAGIAAAASAAPQAAMSLWGADVDVAVTRHAIALPSGCAPREVASRFNEFFAALEVGEPSSLAAFFAKDDPPGKATEPAGRAFRWYSVTEGGGAGPETGGNREPLRHFVAYDVADLLPYLAERQRQHERMRLVAVEVATSNTAGSAGGIFVVRRDADDLVPGLGGNERIGFGKFVIDCAERRFFVWSMGMNLAPGENLARSVSPCPLPPGWAPGTPAVACTRGPNARALATGFRLGRAAVALPAKCGPASVKRRVVRALAAFNTGLGEEFARQFVSRGQFHPYTASISGSGFIGAKAMSRFVSGRYKAGDGWTATAVRPPTGRVGLPREAVYLLELKVAYQGALVTGQVGAKLVVDCASGRLRRWTGPALPLPG
jgi:hypothetical protein